ncbi:MAG: WYL domain-containing transcriptional regulator [Ignavibacteriaceae bacterium]|nr:WYL domain-containing transcriptional regulator [Ignavibacteriaceae bacterium]
MSDLAKKISRRAEILSFAMDPDKKNLKSVPALCDYYGVEPVTINRSLRELRDEGIQISARKKLGVKYYSGLDEEKAKKLIIEYASFNLPAPSVVKATNLLVKRHGVEGLRHFVFLAHCLEERYCVKFLYEKKVGDETERMVEPTALYVNDGQWRLSAKENGRTKQFLLDKIRNVECTTLPAISPRQSPENLLKEAWGSWVSSLRFTVRIRFDKERAQYIKTRLFIENQKIEEQPDGSVIFSATVNDLNEISNWILGWGRGCEVLNPLQLRELVIRLAEETLENYTDKKPPKRAKNK